MTASYATWNPSDKGSACTLSNGNLTATGVWVNGSVRSTVGVSSGKWYWEITSTGSRYPFPGVALATAPLSDVPGGESHGWSYYGVPATAKKYHSGVLTTYGTQWTAGQVLGVALDMDAGTLEFYKNGVSMGVAFTGLTGTMYAMTGGEINGSTSNTTANFGASAFAFSVPSGFNAGLYPITVVQASGFATSGFGTPYAVFSQIEQASGFASSQFGTPLAVWTQIERASGFASSSFGTPKAQLVQQAASVPTTSAFGAPKLIPCAVGFATSRFGIPSIPLVASGFTSSAFGTGSATQRFRAFPIGRTSRFGTPTTPTDRTAQASGFASSQFGSATAVRFGPPALRRIKSASGFRTSSFGTPTAAPTFSGQASGFASSEFGTPVARIGHRGSASGIASTSAFGTPASTMIAHAHGFASSGFGTPKAGRVQRASTIGATSRFGTPIASCPNAHQALSLGVTSRFGQPTARVQFPHPVTGFATSGFGTPSCRQVYRASGMGPTSRFGTPLLKRNPACIDRYLASSIGQTSRFGRPKAIQGP